MANEMIKPVTLADLFAQASKLTDADRMAHSANGVFTTKRIGVPNVDPFTGEIRRGTKTGAEYLTETLGGLAEKARTGSIKPSNGVQLLLDSFGPKAQAQAQ